MNDFYPCFYNIIIKIGNKHLQCLQDQDTLDLEEEDMVTQEGDMEAGPDQDMEDRGRGTSARTKPPINLATSSKGSVKL